MRSAKLMLGTFSGFFALGQGYQLAESFMVPDKSAMPCLALLCFGGVAAVAAVRSGLRHS